MNFKGCSDLGDFGVETVMRWLAARHRVYENRMVRTDKGRISLQLQQTVGDILYNADRLTVMSIEVKTEQRASRNLFLETWSNASSELERMREGWMLTLDADWLFYYFVETDTLCTVDFQKLKTWAFRTPRHDGSLGRLFDYPEKAQKKHQQLNLTRGRCVPIAVLQAEVGLRLYTLNPAGILVPPTLSPSGQATSSGLLTSGAGAPALSQEEA